MSEMTLLDKAAEAATEQDWAEAGIQAPFIMDRYVEAARRRIVLAVARVILSAPASEGMAAAARAALRQGGLIPAYTDEGKRGQTPLLHILLRENALPAASSALLSELSGAQEEATDSTATTGVAGWLLDLVRAVEAQIRSANGEPVRGEPHTLGGALAKVPVQLRALAGSSR